MTRNKWHRYKTPEDNDLYREKIMSKERKWIYKENNQRNIIKNQVK